MASGQLAQVITRMSKDGGFRQAVRTDLEQALALGGYALTDDEKLTLVQTEAPGIGLDRRVTKALTGN